MRRQKAYVAMASLFGFLVLVTGCSYEDSNNTGSKAQRECGAGMHWNPIQGCVANNSGTDASVDDISEALNDAETTETDSPSETAEACAEGGDSDGDGLSNACECELNTNQNDPDTDGDGLPDGVEDQNKDGELGTCPDRNHNEECAHGELDPCKVDTDGDGTEDGEEVEFRSCRDSDLESLSEPKIISNASANYQLAVE